MNNGHFSRGARPILFKHGCLQAEFPKIDGPCLGKEEVQLGLVSHQTVGKS